MIQHVTPIPFEQHKPGRITLKDVAHAAGLSVASVSMALRNISNVSERTTARVKEIARDLNYSPDPALSALAEYRKTLHAKSIGASIALVTNHETEDGWTRFPNARQFITSASARAAELGYSLQHMWARESGASARRFNQILEARGIRGLVLAPLQHHTDELPLNWKHFCVIALERLAGVGPFDFVEPDQFHALQICWEKLLERGYQRVGLVVDDHFSSRWDHQWEAAHTRHQFEHATRMQRVPALTVGEHQPLRQIRAWLRKHRPDVVIGRSRFLLSALEAEGRTPGRDIGYVSLNTDDDIRDAAGIAQRFDILGSAAIDSLHHRLLGNLRGPCENPLRTQVCGNWREGKTLPGKLPAMPIKPAESRRARSAATAADSKVA